MTLGARFGRLVFLTGLLACPALAQDGRPATIAPDAASSAWTDPPVRGAVGPEAPGATKPAENAASPEKSVQAPAKPSRRAAAPGVIAPPDATARQQAARENQPTRRSTKLRRERIRVAARSRIASDARAQRDGHAVRGPDMDAARSERRRRLADHRTYAYRAYRSLAPRQARGYAMSDGPDEIDAGLVPYRSRRAGWGGLIRDNRIARARAAGYIVMRSRTYAYPNGMYVRELTPYEPSAFD